MSDQDELGRLGRDLDEMMRRLRERRRATGSFAVSKASPPQSLEGVHILLVHDEAAGRESLTLALAEYGALVRAVGGAREAMAELDAAVPDVILSALAMPEVDGYAFIRTVRSRDAERGGNVPAVALNSRDRDTDRL